MKILDRYILKSFLTTFGSVFVILFLIFILQTVWLFIAELAGKDLDFILIVKFLTFSMPGIVPLVLPLSVLLASIMTFGDLSENYEFAAMKSSGVSLQRSMRSLVVFILMLSACAFVFANNIIPYSQYKFINFKANIAQVKPAMAIAEGQFNDVGSFNIKVDKKSGEKGNTLTGVTIHKKAVDGSGNTTVIRAEKGELRSSEDSNILQLILFNGYQFEDIIPKKYEDRKKMPFAKTEFRKYIMNMDLSKLNKVDVEDQKISNTSVMLNLSELNYTLDSLNVNYKKELSSYADNILVRTGINAVNTPIIIQKHKDSTDNVVPKATASTSTTGLLDPYTKEEKGRILDIVKGNVTNTTSAIWGAKDEFNEKQKNISSHWLSVYDKFVMAYACLLMFFIGAPLGAIIRKGGLGLPIVFAILIFITFHFINTFGKKIAQENGITPFLGAWMSSIILTPLAVLLTYNATNDIQMSFSFDWLTDPFVRIFRRNKTRPSFDRDDRVVNLDTARIIENEEYRDMLKLSDTALINTVYDAKKHGYDEARRVKALKILSDRGITQDDLLRDDKLFNKRYELLADAAESYHFNAKMTMILYFISIIMALVLNNNRSVKGIFIAALVALVLFYISCFKTGQRLTEISKILSKRIGLHPFITTLFGFPLYILFHLYNRKAVSEALAESDL